MRYSTVWIVIGGCNRIQYLEGFVIHRTVWFVIGGCNRTAVTGGYCNIT